MSEEEKTKCIACKESILAGATICPQCQTYQKKQLAKSLLSVLKELSSVMVIFSLIFAVMELNRFADSWFENSAYVSRLVTSASMLIEAGEYTGARKLLSDAKKISPSSEEVNVLQMQLAMISIRDNAPSRTPTEIQITTHSRDVLYHSLGRSPKSDATVLAHIAWASYLIEDSQTRVDINLYLDKALSLDKASVYANLYKGRWYLDIYPYLQLSDPMTDAEIITKAQEYFEVALQQNIDYDYIRKVQLASLKYYTGNSNSAAYLETVLSMHANNDPYFIRNQKQVVSNLFHQFYSAINDALAHEDEYLNNIFLRQNNQVINTLKKISSPMTPYQKSIFIVLTAIENNFKKDYLSAIDNHIKAYKLIKETSSGLRYKIPAFLKNICKKSELLDPQSIERCNYFFDEVIKSR